MDKFASTYMLCHDRLLPTKFGAALPACSSITDVKFEPWTSLHQGHAPNGANICHTRTWARRSVVFGHSGCPGRLGCGGQGSALRHLLGTRHPGAQSEFFDRISREMPVGVAKICDA